MERTIGRRPRTRCACPARTSCVSRKAIALRRRTAVESSPSRGFAFVAVAIGGLLVGHTLSYVFAVPDPYHRDLVLQQSGHGYLPGVTEAAVVLAVGAIAGLLGSGARGRAARTPRFAGVAGAMVATQVVAFVALEVLERLVARTTLGDLGHHHLLAIGIATQVVIALVGAALLAWLTRTSERVASVLTQPVAPPLARPVFAFAAPASAPVGSAAFVADPIRGPPPR